MEKRLRLRFWLLPSVVCFWWQALQSCVRMSTLVMTFWMSLCLRSLKNHGSCADHSQSGLLRAVSCTRVDLTLNFDSRTVTLVHPQVR